MIDLTDYWPGEGALQGRHLRARVQHAGTLAKWEFAVVDRNLDGSPSQFYLGNPTLTPERDAYDYYSWVGGHLYYVFSGYLHPQDGPLTFWASPPQLLFRRWYDPAAPAETRSLRCLMLALDAENEPLRAARAAVTVRTDGMYSRTEQIHRDFASGGVIAHFIEEAWLGEVPLCRGRGALRGVTRYRKSHGDGTVHEDVEFCWSDPQGPAAPMNSPTMAP